jgi:ethanolamine transporter EutH
MGTLPWKLRIAVLWAIGPVLELAHLFLNIGVEEKGTARLGNLVVHSTFFFLIPLLMCLLSLTLKDKWNKRLNIVLGIFFGFVSAPIWFLEGGLGVIMYDGPPIGLEHALLLGFKIVVALFIPWFAWKWPTQEE